MLDALEVRHGPSHMEVKMTPTGPCLVEVGARCHGLEVRASDEVAGTRMASLHRCE